MSAHSKIYRYSSLWLCIVVLLLGVARQATAAPVVSLLTCGPTDKYVFYLYGHTALRVQDGEEDWVFNYGYFSPTQEHFVLNFMLGKPMYSVGVTTYSSFVSEYGVEGRSVIEQVLNLKPEEATAMYDFLKWNVRPENSEYQYNFYFDNCATRPRDLIEQYSGGIDYRVDGDSMPTFRTAIRQMSHAAGWYTMGADLCLGWQSDRTMSISEAAFLPMLLEQELDMAVRHDDGTPIVLAKHEILPQRRIITGDQGALQPFWAIWIIIAIYVVTYILSKNGYPIPLKCTRSLLYLIMASGGVVLYFLGLVSAHPHTFPNANMLLMHPLYFLLIGGVWTKKQLSRSLFWLYLINFVAILLYLGLGYMQKQPEGVGFLALLMGVDAYIGMQANHISRRRGTVQ